MKKLNNKECPYVIMEVRKGFPRHIANVNWELTDLLCEQWEMGNVTDYEEANQYIKAMEKPERYIWLNKIA